MICPICNSNQFKDFRGRKQAECVKCTSLERHRAVFLLILDIIFQSNKKKILHLSPEKSIKDKLKEFKGLEYTSSDIEDGEDIKAPLEQLPMEDGIYNLIICNHVLEHVIDPNKCIQEMYRVLENDGFIIITVPPNKDNQPDHRRYFSENDLQKLIEKNAPNCIVDKIEPKDEQNVKYHLGNTIIYVVIKDANGTDKSDK